MKKSTDLQTNDHYRSTYYRSHKRGSPMQTPNMNEPAKTRRYRTRFASLLGGSQMEELYKLKNEIEVFKKEFAWELTFDKEIQAELRALRDKFYCMAKFFFKV